MLAFPFPNACLVRYNRPGMAHRFFIPADRISGDIISFTDEQRSQLRNVLRLRAGDSVTAFDGSGREFITEIEALDEKHAVGKVLEIKTPATEPPVRLTIVQSLPKGEKIDLILQKCTEIGVSEFLITETARSVPKIDPNKLPGRLDRWHAVIREAAEQSGRTRLPVVDGIIPFQDALARVKGKDIGLIAWEEETGPTLASMLPRLSEAREIAYFVGPEGGFTSDEVAAAKAAGIVPVSLGPRILRTETAAIVGSALIIYAANTPAISG